jgi:ubiquinone/menaquinone biosynthesis C-methylase UbiE
MKVDPQNNCIQAINTCAPLKNKDVLEVGCGNGRMTRDIASYAKRVVATDVDQTRLLQAAQNLTQSNIELLHVTEGQADLEAASFDYVVYSLSLHHIPAACMLDHLKHSTSLLNKNGKIVVIEPGNKGSFLTLKKHFGAGSGDEDPEKAAAIEAMNALDGWDLSPTYSFEINFFFSDYNDFLKNKLPDHKNLSGEKLAEIKKEVLKYRTAEGIMLSSERSINLLKRH